MKRFGFALAGLTACALVIRLVYGLTVMDGHTFSGDAIEFQLLARTLVETGSYLQPVPWLLEHQAAPTAEKPPLFPLYLAVWNGLGLTSSGWQIAASALLGSAAVAVIGAVGRRVAGNAAGLVAAAVAAVCPSLLLIDASLRSESLYVLLIALSLLAAYRVADRPTLGRAGALGAVIGLAALTRSEALALVLLLGLPAVWLGTRPGARFKPALALCAGCAVLVVPWLARNWIEFDRPAGLSTNEGGLLAGANCGRAYHGELIGSWACFPDGPIGPRSCNRELYHRLLGREACYPAPRARRDRNEAAVSARLRRRAATYALDHPTRVPPVAGVRLLRTWELWDPADHARLEALFGDRNVRVSRWAQPALYLLAALALAGAVVLKRRREPLRLLVALPLLVSLSAVATYGSTRFRAAAEVSLVVLAAVALTAAVPLLWARLRPAGDGGAARAPARP